MLLSLLVILVVVLPGAFLEAVVEGDKGFGRGEATASPADVLGDRTMRSLRGDPATATASPSVEGSASVGKVDAASTDSPYVILCDAGSSGTRLYVYRRRTPSEVASSSDGREVDIQVGSKVKPGLSAQTPDGVAAYLRPSLLEAASKMIPSKYHSSTPVVVYATAGMRLLPHEVEMAIYDGLVDGLKEDADVQFLIERENFKTIPGDDEGYFAALAVNYLDGRVGANLTPQSAKEVAAGGQQEGEGDGKVQLLGALDLGGASAQVVFPLDSSDASPESSSATKRRLGAQSAKQAEAAAAASRPLGRDDFFSASLLGFGGDQIRHKLDSFLAESGTQNKDGDDTVPIYNPCYFKGYSDTLDGVLHSGTGNAEMCLKYVEAVMARNPPENADDIPSDMQDKHFYAMTLYYYVLDFSRDVLDELESKGGATDATTALREKLSTPSPAVSLLKDAASTVCSWDFKYLSKHASAYDDFTGSDNMPHRCMELTYVTALLKRLGLSNPAKADIQFVDTVGGESVEWTLGAYLHLSNGGERQLNSAGALGRRTGRTFFAMALGGWMLVAYVVRRHLRQGKGGDWQKAS